MKASVLISFVLLVGVECHSWGWGECPKVDPLPSFTVDKFVGVWYVIEQFDTSSSCLTLNYTKQSETSLIVTKGRQFYLLDVAGVDHKNSYTGVIDIPSAAEEGRMRVKWPLNVAGKADYIVFDTDYITYAGVYDCQQITRFGHRLSVSILSRQPTLESLYTDRVKRRLTKFGVDTEEFDKISHDGCVEKSGFNINVDENIFRDVLADTADTFRNVATKVRDAVGLGESNSDVEVIS